MNRLFTLLACRPPNNVEQSAVTSLLREQRKLFQAHPDQAKALLAIGDAQAKDKLNTAELAAWSQVAATVLASDVAILLY